MTLKTVTVYTKASGCVMCNATHRSLSKTDILYTEQDATVPANREFGMSLGHMQAPVVTVHQDGVLIDHWSGFNPGKLDELKKDPLVARKMVAAELVAA